MRIERRGSRMSEAIKRGQGRGGQPGTRFFSFPRTGKGEERQDEVRTWHKRKDRKGHQSSGTREIGKLCSQNFKIVTGVGSKGRRAGGKCRKRMRRSTLGKEEMKQSLTHFGERNGMRQTHNRSGEEREKEIGEGSRTEEEDDRSELFRALALGTSFR